MFEAENESPPPGRGGVLGYYILGTSMLHVILSAIVNCALPNLLVACRMHELFARTLCKVLLAGQDLVEAATAFVPCFPPKPSPCHVLLMLWGIANFAHVHCGWAIGVAG